MNNGRQVVYILIDEPASREGEGIEIFGILSSEEEAKKWENSMEHHYRPICHHLYYKAVSVATSVRDLDAVEKEKQQHERMARVEEIINDLDEKEQQLAKELLSGEQPA